MTYIRSWIYPGLASMMVSSCECRSRCGAAESELSRISTSSCNKRQVQSVVTSLRTLASVSDLIPRCILKCKLVCLSSFLVLFSRNPFLSDLTCPKAEECEECKEEESPNDYTAQLASGELERRRSR